MTLPPPPLHWQLIGSQFSIVFPSYNDLIRTPFSTENYLPFRILPSHPGRKWLVLYYNWFLNQTGFQGSRNGTGRPHPTSRWKHFAFLPWLRSLQTTITICKWRGYEKHQQKQKSDQQWVLLFKFKVLLKRTFTPKHSFNDGELMTGEGKGYYWIFVSRGRETRNFSQISMYFSDGNYWFWRQISRC